ncbi:hypothetical protein PPIS_b0057 [Pseudoalteromonas piscicida]|uniref:Uncharacterized protein n=1 Tax=Pseudoalteromonas piscicida TaxID=43662 RepID=A0ABM6NJX5_PSEO7|nr:hypothetical protein PPIS_b0057 [Pseudoalteromonas piscicida]
MEVNSTQLALKLAARKALIIQTRVIYLAKSARFSMLVLSLSSLIHFDLSTILRSA